MRDENIRQTSARRATWAVAAAALALALAVGGSGAWSAGARTISGPLLGRTVEIAPVRGHVFVQALGTRGEIPLLHLMSIPVGSTVDVTHGAVAVTARLPRGGVQRGVFSRGAFVVTQARDGMTRLRLTGGIPLAACTRSSGTAATVARARPKVTVRRTLFGHAHGRFTTQGQYGSAAVLGTEWTTTDTCAGTTISDQTDEVDTTANSFPESVHVPLTPGESVTYHCARRAGSQLGKPYCVVVLTERVPPLNQPAFSTFLATTNPAQSAQLCIQAPRAAMPRCTTYPLSPATDQGLRDLNVACPVSQGPGLYRIAYRLDGVALGPPFAYRAPHIRLGHGPCQSLLGQLKEGTGTAALAANIKIVNRYTLLSPATSPWMGLDLKPTGAPGTEQVEGIVYADENGAPGALVATTRPVTIGRASPARLYSLFFRQALRLSPGKYWLGVLTGGNSGVAAIRAFPTPHSAPQNANRFAAGPRNPFGPIARIGAVQMTLLLDYSLR